MSFKIIRNDITKVTADAIVNTANPLPQIGTGTDTAIYEAAGRAKMLEARSQIGRIERGQVAVTPAFDLPAKYVIHTVGPSWEGGENDELEILASCYRNSLLLADRLGCESIAFPLISAGNYGVPKDKALDTALREIESFLKVREMEVTLVVFDREAFKLSTELVDDVSKYIEANFVEEEEHEQALFEASAIEECVDDDYVDGAFESEYRDGYGRRYEDAMPEPYGALDVASDKSVSKKQSLFKPRGVQGPSERFVTTNRAPKASLDDVLREGLGQTFQEKLLSLIDAKGFTDTEVYKRANVDRKAFSKIRCNVNYQPKKKTALAFVLALGLNLDEAIDLLGRAGLAFSPSDKRDVIVQYCIIHEIYNIFDVDALLFNYDLQPLS